MQLSITYVDRTKSGKGYMVTSAGGEKYYSKAMGIEQSLGKTIEAELGSFSTPNGSVVKTIDSFSLVDGSIKAPGVTVAVDRFYMPFVSNLCAQAILTGLIKEPADIRKWAIAAKNAALSLDETGDEPDF